MTPSPKRAATEVEVPSREQDPAERARLLNVLAQRRYRNRRRTRLQALEALVNANRTAHGNSSVDSANGQSSSSENGSAAFTMGEVDQPLTGPIRDAETDAMNLGIDIDATQFSELNDLFPLVGSSIAQTGSTTYDPTLFGSVGTIATSAPTHSMLLTNTPASILPTDSPGPSWNTVSVSTANGPPTTPNLDRDSHYMHIPSLALLRAHFHIFQRITNFSTFDVWDFAAQSPFCSTTSRTPQDLSLVPANYRPTPSQSQLPHHPLFDILPWPSVRNILVAMLGLPEEARPPRMRGGRNQVILNFMGDLKDAEGGIRISGNNPFNQENWEVGQLFLDRWWWALSEEIVTRSNALREARGEARLRIRSVE